MSSSAVVVGGGIAGLAAAVALRGRGWQVVVVERQPALSEIGAGLTLWPNALRALDALGVGPAIRALGTAEGLFGLREHGGRWLSRTDTAALADRFGDGIVVLERRQLLAALRDACADVDIRVSTQVDTVTDDGVVTTSSGDRITADLVIGADGLWSTVRRQLWPDSTIRPAGSVAARLIARVDGRPVTGFGETWGRGDYAGMVPLPDGRLYAYLVVPATAGAPTELLWWRQRFADWHFPLPQLLAEVEPAQLLVNELFDIVPLRSLVRGHVALVGDAGHAMTPNLGQGACQALEDAVELAARLDPDADVAPGLSRYDASRLPRVRRLAIRSRAAGRPAALHSRLPVLARNTLVSLLPGTILLRGFDAPVRWHPPPPDPPGSGQSLPRNKTP